MARVTLSPFFTSIQGSVGNATFQKSQGGYILRTKPLAPASLSESQYRAKRYLRLVQKAWYDLSDTNRNKYINYVKLRPALMRKNRSLHLSPYNLFLRYNLIRLHAGLDILESIYFDYSLDPFLEPSIDTDGFELYFYFPGCFCYTNKCGLWKLSSPVRKTHYNNFSKLRVFPVSDKNECDYIEIHEQYLKTFHKMPEVGDTIFCSYLLFHRLAPLFLSTQFEYLVVTET